MKPHLTIEQEILKTLRSINQTAAETDKVSSATAEVVSAQGEQIDNINRNTNKIQENLNTTEWLIRGMKSWGGKLQNALYGPTLDRYPSEVLRQQPANLEKPPSRPASYTTQKSDFDNEVDNHLDSISNVLGGIHARSLALQQEISRQVNTLENADKSLERSNDRIRKQHHDMKSLR